MPTLEPLYRANDFIPCTDLLCGKDLISSSYALNASTFLFKTELKYIGIVYVLLSLIQIPIENPGGNIAHIGGAFCGYYYAMNLYNNSFSINFRNFFNKVKDYNLSQSENQKKIDTILDKISESGYESLTKKEKEFLFKSKDHL